MKHLKKTAFILFIIFTSCNDSQKKYEGAWVVGQAYYNNEPVIWDMYSNIFYLNKDNTCELPIYNTNDRYTGKKTGHWHLLKKGEITYIQIKTKNSIFNRTFKIEKIEQIPHPFAPGDQLKIILTSDSLKFDCFKELPL